jgi:hypothetical protein
MVWVVVRGREEVTRGAEAERKRLVFVRAGVGGTIQQVSEALGRVVGRPVALGEVRERKGQRGAACFTVMLQDEGVVGEVLRGKTKLKGTPIFVDRFRTREERIGKVAGGLLGQRDKWAGVGQQVVPRWGGRQPFLAYLRPLPGWG